jgi:hypothetical protein
METDVNYSARASAVRVRRLQLRQCPHCGGDVRLVKDIYGSYRQCFQCSREITPVAMEQSQHNPVAFPAHTGAEELLAA